MNQDQNGTVNPAFDGFAQALLRIASRNGQAVSSELTETLESLMQTFALADAEGSVCVTLQGWTERRTALGCAPCTKTQLLGPLLESGLMVPMDRSVGNLLCPSGTPQINAPLVLDDGKEPTQCRLYFQRNFYDEMRLAQAIKTLAAVPRRPMTEQQHSKLRELDAADRSPIHARQRQAIEAAVGHNFTVIYGGPGTGKTTTVVRILECLLLEAPELQIYLAAPTGKATGRMRQSIDEACERLPEQLAQVRQCRRLTHHTIHKWLYTRSGDGQSVGAGHCLAADVLVIDEGSMIDIGLAVKLFDAIDPLRTRVIVLGDRFQLAAVGPGSVFADLSQYDASGGGCVIELTQSHRFPASSPIGRLAQAIKSPDDGTQEGRRSHVHSVIDLLEAQSFERSNTIVWHRDRTERSSRLSVSAQNWLTDKLTPYIAQLRQLPESRQAGRESYLEALRALWRTVSSFRALAAQRQGEQSVQAINAWVDAQMRTAFDLNARVERYVGRIVIVRRNDDQLNVFNGDVGIMVPSLDAGQDREQGLDVYFGDKDVQDGSPFLKAGLLPDHDTAYAMTIHQSQGSEFMHVAVFLPTQADSPIGTRELLYTAVTRTCDQWIDGTKHYGSLTLFGSAEALATAVTTATQRVGGLSVRLATVPALSVSDKTRKRT